MVSKDEAGKKFIDFKWFIGFIITLILAGAALGASAFFTKWEGKALEARVQFMDKRQERIITTLDKMDDKLDVIIREGR